MTLSEDPENTEMKMIRNHASLTGKDILEVGCGNGRLTFQYAASTRSVVALDASNKAIAEARKNTPGALKGKLSFRVGRGESLAFPNESFDLVFFSWSLCCADIPAMGKALDEAWRVLRPQGVLVNIQSSLHQPFHKGMISYLMERNSGPYIKDEGDRQARLALRHASVVDRKFGFAAEREFPVFSYYDTVGEALKDVVTQNGYDPKDLSKETKKRILEILTSMKRKTGVKIEENAVLTVLKKSRPEPA
ncbi:MAG: class I SAM-dependent methyltransferase [Thaumarchaeota archaeon]|nr:class I SAM-dependent methyltransferase [Nitrososphaerota archaeon]